MRSCALAHGEGVRPVLSNDGQACGFMLARMARGVGRNSSLWTSNASAECAVRWRVIPTARKLLSTYGFPISETLLDAGLLRGAASMGAAVSITDLI